MTRNDPLSLVTLADEVALSRLFQEHRSRLMAIISRRIDPALAHFVDAEGVFADAFLMARRKWAAAGGDPRPTPFAWLYRIALDCLVDAWRRESRPCRDYRGRVPLPSGSSCLFVEGLVHPGTSPSAGAAREELRVHVHRAVALLKEEDAEVLWMRHTDELTFPEIAALLGVSENTANKRYERALSRLCRLWCQLHPEAESHP